MKTSTLKVCSDAFGFGLLPILDGDAPPRTVSEQLPETRQAMGGNQANSRTRRDEWSRVIDHRLVVNRLELFAITSVSG
jgi:hypothetical protein